jgi:hypothetical protein
VLGASADCRTTRESRPGTPTAPAATACTVPAIAVPAWFDACQIGPIVTGLWCPTCALPSGGSMTFGVESHLGFEDVRTVTMCLDCDLILLRQRFVR